MEAKILSLANVARTFKSDRHENRHRKAQRRSCYGLAVEEVPNITSFFSSPVR
jgi:hypothetical protein